MEAGYVIAKRAPGGQAREIACATHDGCTWKLAVPAARSDADPIIVAMFSAHITERRQPDAPAGGHMRKPRK